MQFTKTEVKFNDLSKDEAIHLGKAMLRYKTLCEKNGIKFDYLSREMDLIATHSNGCPLDFEALAKFEDFSLTHDFVGIAQHLDRRDGKLGGCFSPRCARPNARERANLDTVKETSNGG